MSLILDKSFRAILKGTNFKEFINKHSREKEEKVSQTLEVIDFRWDEEDKYKFSCFIEKRTFFFNNFDRKVFYGKLHNIKKAEDINKEEIPLGWMEYPNGNNIKLILDIDKSKPFKEDESFRISDFTKEIVNGIDDCLARVFGSEYKVNKDDNVLKNTKSGNLRIYILDVTVTESTKNHFLRCCSEFIVADVREKIHLDEWVSLRTLYCNKWKNGEMKEGLYLKGGNRYDNLVKYSIFSEEELTPLLQPYNLLWAEELIPKKLIEAAPSTFQIAPAHIPVVLGNLDPDMGRPWHYLIKALFRIGISKEAIHQWSSQSPQYDERAIAEINSLNIDKFDERCLLKLFKEGTDMKRMRGILFPESKGEKMSQTVVDKIIKKNVDKLFDLKLTGPNVFVYEEKYVRAISSDTRCEGIHAMCGMGKTLVGVEDVIKENSDKKILILSPRITFTNSLIERIKRETGVLFTNYSDRQGTIKEERVVCQVESIHRLSLIYDFVIIDEIESCLVQLTCKATNGKNFDNNNREFRNQILCSQKVIFMDAFLTQRSVEYFHDIGIVPTIRCYTHAPIQKRAIQFPYSKEKNSNSDAIFTEFLIRELKAGKKIYFPCMSRNKQEIILKKIEMDVPNVRILAYNRENKLGKDVNVNEEWVKYDIVSTTSTITVGVNFDVDYFDFTAVYLSTMSTVNARDTLQCVYRVRHTAENTLYWIHNSWRLKHVQASYEAIKKEFANREQLHKETIATIIKEETPKMPPHIRNLYIWNKFEDAMNIMNKEEIWKMCLQISNYSLEEFNSMGSFEDVIPLPKYIEFSDYDDIKEIVHSEYDRMKKSKAEMSTENLNILIKYEYQCLFFDKTEKFLSEKWNDFLRYRSVFYNISKEKGYDPDMIIKIAIKEATEYAEFCSLYSNKLQILFWIRENLGIHNSRDFETDISRESIIELSTELKKVSGKLHTLFKIRSSDAKSDNELKNSLFVLNGILNAWSGTKIVATNKRRTTFRLKDAKELGPELYEKIKPVEKGPVVKGLIRHVGPDLSRNAWCKSTSSNNRS